MTVSVALDLQPAHLEIVTGILRAHLPGNASVWVFGSRATGRARPYSDVDLLIDAGRRLTLHESGSLADVFDESDLPYKVDIVDRHAVSPQFRETIERNGMLAIDLDH
jgi:predicted nucleotidyltransferase